VTEPAPDLLALLRQYFGWSSFRPLQEQIIRDALAGRDVFALLPTGGGKSLCFQLPAVVRPGLTVVVSPLIALMKDQVDQLQAAGIPATFLNSSLSAAEARPRLRGLHQGQFRLLYVAPERLLLSGFLADLQAWNMNQLAIDEAHCISEWGHDFRPEYRQLSELRTLFPQCPLMALTATATDRVRSDIVEQLRLRSPACYVASFNRPNLTYVVLPKQRPYDQVVQFIRNHLQQAGIIYCQARKSAEVLASRLTASGIPARPYHAGLSAEERCRNQELFLRDEVPVICATVAFGMGINKPNVRFVIHYDLPRNIEGYYQETGRAGRDGLPARCVLLFSAGDVVKYSRFIDEKNDPKEKEIARRQLQQITHYAESAQCRRRELLSYFAESFETPNCGGCDNCLNPRGTYDGTLAAQKFLSCVYRIRQQSGFDFGLNQVADVLAGAQSRNVQKWNHHQVSTFGIGGEHTRAEWKAIGRELIRLGFLEQRAEKFAVVALTTPGLAALKQRQRILLPRPVQLEEPSAVQDARIACDETLFEQLCHCRKHLADERNVPPHVLFSDVTLRQIARDYPQTVAQLSRIPGLSSKKLEEFGPDLLTEVAAHLQHHPRQLFAETSFAAPDPSSARGSDKPAAASAATESQLPVDPQLFERLRALRKQIAIERGLPAYMILHDSVLRQMTRDLPKTNDEFARISKVGARRADQWGPIFLPELIRYLGGE
jgi:ATP-dependent DNA helicase RecQ